MKVDLVHDIQAVYRKVINSMARPGLVSELAEQAEKVDVHECFPSSLLMVLTLLDTEVTFKVVSRREEELTKLINQWTYAKAAKTEQADFLFILHDADSQQAQAALCAAKVGDLRNPHESATIIMEADAITTEDKWMLRGPGIETTTGLHVRTNVEWVEIRAAKTAEYPLGIDLIFVDSTHRLVCVPRTTQILKQVGE